MMHPKPTKPVRRRGHRDPVSPELHSAVLRRDGQCIAAVLDPSHRCRDQWGESHSPFALDKMTVEHVKDHARMGVRAPSDMAHLVTMCHHGNLYWASAHRVELRAFLDAATR